MITVLTTRASAFAVLVAVRGLDPRQHHRPAAALAVDDLDVARLRADHVAQRGQPEELGLGTAVEDSVQRNIDRGQPAEARADVEPVPFRLLGEPIERVGSARRAPRGVQHVERRRHDRPVAARTRRGLVPVHRVSLHDRLHEAPQLVRTERTGRGEARPLDADERRDRLSHERHGRPAPACRTRSPRVLSNQSVDGASRQRAEGGSVSYPRVHIVEECMREGMQIESVDITTEDKVRLLDALSRTGLETIVVGSFVSPRYTPQMAAIDDLVGRFAPRAGGDLHRRRPQRQGPRACRRLHPAAVRRRPGRRRSSAISATPSRDATPTPARSRRSSAGRASSPPPSSAGRPRPGSRSTPRGARTSRARSRSSSGWRCCGASTRSGTRPGSLSPASCSATR